MKSFFSNRSVSLILFSPVNQMFKGLAFIVFSKFHGNSIADLAKIVFSILDYLMKTSSNHTLVDIRNQSELSDGKFFEQSIAHPLNKLRDTMNEIPTNKPIVVHCAGGYRSATGSSILESGLRNATIFDLSENIKDFI